MGITESLLDNLLSINIGKNLFKKPTNEELHERRILLEGVAKAKELYLDTNKIPGDVFDKLVQKDPTNQKKYIEWMCKVWTDDPEKNTVDKFDVMKDFDNFVNRKIIGTEDKDIGKYKTLDSLIDIVKKNIDQKSAAQQRKDALNQKVVIGKDRDGKDIVEKAANKVFENSKCKIYKLHTKEAAIFIGKATKWCTSAEINNYFNNYYYNQSCSLYYIVPKGNLLQKMGKLAVLVRPSGNKEYFDEKDQKPSSSSVDTYMTTLGIDN